MISGSSSASPSDGAQRGVALGRAEFAQFDPQRDDIDLRRRPSDAQLRRAAILAHREHRVEAAIEPRGISIGQRATPPRRPAARATCRPRARHRPSENRCSRPRPARFRDARGDARSPPTADYRRPGIRSGRADARPAPRAPRDCAAATGNWGSPGTCGEAIVTVIARPSSSIIVASRSPGMISKWRCGPWSRIWRRL